MSEGIIEKTRIVGADVGGSKAALAMLDERGERRDIVVASAAWHRQGEGAVARSLAGLIRAEVGDEVILVVGAHGTDTPDQCARLVRELSAELDGRVLALNDAELLLPAAGVSRGVGLVSGTGSIAIGYDGDERLVTVGGWGGYISDQGSATGLFLAAAQAVIEACDRGESGDPLEEILLELCGLDALRDLPKALGDMGSPTGWAHLTPALLGQALANDSVLAPRVIRDAAATLAGWVRLLAARGCDAATVVAGGGLVARAPWLQSALRDAIAATLPDSALVVLTAPPVDGALALAEALHRVLAGLPTPLAEHPALGRFLTRPTPGVAES